MKFYRNAVYVLFFVSLVNLATTVYLYSEILERENNFSIDIVVPEDLKDMPKHSMLRDSQLLQSILMIHHQIGIHEPGQQEFCPMCTQNPNIQTIIQKVEK
jgi:hypothetical protein